MLYWFNTPAENRKVMGETGRQFCLDNGLTAEKMGDKMIEMFNYYFGLNIVSKPFYTLTAVTENKYENTGIVA